MIILWLLLTAFLALPAPAQLAPTTLLSCPTATGGDLTHRGFYIEAYPGETLDSVTVYMATQAGGPLAYEVGIDVFRNSYGGPHVGTYFTSLNIGPVETAVTIPCANVAVPLGGRLCFRFFIGALPGAPALLYSVPPMGFTCPNIVQTHDTTPPLSTYRRGGV